MALVILLLSGLGATLVALVAFFGFDVSLMQAFTLYLTCATLPALLFLSINLLHVLLNGETEDHHEMSNGSARVRTASLR